MKTTTAIRFMVILLLCLTCGKVHADRYYIKVTVATIPGGSSCFSSGRDFSLDKQVKEYFLSSDRTELEAGDEGKKGGQAWQLEWQLETKNEGQEKLTGDREGQTLREKLLEVNATILYSGWLSQIEGYDCELNMYSDCQYLEPVEGGLYRIRDIDEESQPGMWLDVSLSDSIRPGYANLNHSLLVRIITSRKALPGVRMDVGEPVTEQFLLEDEVSFCLDQWQILESMWLSDSENIDGNVLAIFIKIDKRD